MHSVSPLNRTAVFVENVDRSGRFYEEVLGMSLYATEEDIEPSLMPELLGVLGVTQPAALRFRFFRSGEGREGLVALFETSPSFPVLPDREARGVHRGEACLVFFHPDFDELLPRLVAGGCVLLAPPVTLHLPTHDQRELVCRNMDGTLFNFIERTGTLVGVEPRVTQARQRAR